MARLFICIELKVAIAAFSFIPSGVLVQARIKRIDCQFQLWKRKR